MVNISCYYPNGVAKKILIKMKVDNVHKVFPLTLFNSRSVIKVSLILDDK